ncbi:SEC-C metal-binding domain-containing protein [Heyndrickxia acidiproducens]|uniref:SEC-C metal-binding domain-containing protein n=1 Tax=Heyndrickxia acidiproducens TaxID=1121084 RepID=UPI000381C323|nr:SEC-C metal-binding domain-containing protein [Heyndrickxia acidiproducens]
MKVVNPTDILNGKTYSYIDVFDDLDGIVLGTKSNGINYYIYDRYCMNPSCNCEEVILHYVENDEREKWKAAEFGIRISLINKKFEVLQTSGMTKKQARELVEESLKSSDQAMELFQKRYKQMKNAGKEALQRWKQQSKEATQSTRLKPKRNELCPCGSGKKYKKCCGAS